MKKIINYVLALVLWLVSIVLWSSLSFPYVFYLLFGLHFVELVAIGFRTGRAHGVSAGKSILLCMLYGYLWWLPMRQQMTSETFTDLDFVRES